MVLYSDQNAKEVKTNATNRNNKDRLDYFVSIRTDDADISIAGPQLYHAFSIT